MFKKYINNFGQFSRNKFFNIIIKKIDTFGVLNM